MTPFVFRRKQSQPSHASLKMPMLIIAMLMPLTVSAQQIEAKKLIVSNSQTYRISYVDERKLFQKGDVVTLAALNLEWPERITGSDAFDLQNWLCTTLFGKECYSLDDGKEQFYQSLGEEIDALPEGPNIKRQNITLTLTELAWEKDRYMSFRATAQHRDGDTPQPKVNIQRLITYDVMEEKILTAKDLIKGKFMPGKLYHYELLELIATASYQQGIEAPSVSNFLFNGVSTTPIAGKTMRAEDLPDQVCLLGLTKGVAFNLKNVLDGDGLDMLVGVLRYQDLDYFLTAKAIRLLDKIDARKKKKINQTLITEEEVMEDGQPVYLVVDSMPQYPEGVTKMSEFLMQQLNYPEQELNSRIQGRVVVSFVVAADGRICRPSVILPLSPAFDRAAVKAILDMKPWIPGKQNGTPVNVRVAIPLYFRR